MIFIFPNGFSKSVQKLSYLKYQNLTSYTSKTYSLICKTLFILPSDWCLYHEVLCPCVHHEVLCPCVHHEVLCPCAHHEVLCPCAHHVCPPEGRGNLGWQLGPHSRGPGDSTGYHHTLYVATKWCFSDYRSKECQCCFLACCFVWQ